MYKIYIKKFLLAMKLTTLMLFIAIMQVSAVTRAQKVTLSERNAPLTTVFKQIRTQTGYDFAYTNKTLEDTKPVTINVKNAELSDVLQQIFEGQPIDYSIEDKLVVISIKEPSFIDKAKEAVKDFFTNIDVTGRVLDEQGLPIASATVTVKGTSNATITDAKGYFTLKNVDSKSIIVVSVIGYIKRELPAGKDLGDIKLVVAENKLDQVQVIAYGQSSQRLTVGNIGAVSAKEIEEQPLNNPLLTLEGRVPGLFITQNSGIAGGGVTVRIQGQNSVSNGNDPFFVIDGVPYISQMPTTTMLGGVNSPLGSGPGQSPLSFINPSDIESIEVLKDADATAIYGSRAANGAILITTKKGKSGDAIVDVNYIQGWQSTPQLAEMNTQQYLATRKEAFRNDGLIPSANPSAISPYVYAPDLMVWDTTRSTNWQKTLLRNAAFYTNLNASISGGTNYTQYLIGATYNDQGSVFPGDYADQKAALHFNVSAMSANQKFRVQLSGNYMADDNQLPSADLTNTAVILPPDAPPIYNIDGTLNWAVNSLGNNTWTNPLQYLYEKYQNKTNNLIANSIVSYKILPGLEISSTFGYNRLETNEYAYYTQDAFAPAVRPTLILQANYSTNTISSLIIEPQVTYKRTIGKGILNLLLGATIQQSNSDGLSYSGVGYSSPTLLADIKSATSVTINSSLNSIYKYNALFSRLNYIWRDKYILDLTARRDGSSRFGINNLFHDFWSAGGAWIFSDESLVQNALSFLSFGKFKASFGTTGSDQIGDYKYLSLYTSLNSGIAYQGASSIAINGLNNPYLQWEETKKLQLGVDLGFLKDRILLNITFARNRSSDELLSYSLPSITGFSSIAENFPATIQNISWEFSLNSQNIKSKNFNWTTNFNLTIPKNELIDFPNLSSSSYSTSLFIGQPVSVQKAYHFLGVDPATGLYRVADRFGNPTSSPSTLDLTVLYNTLPKFYGGFQNSFRYKGVQLDLFFQFVSQKGLYTGVFGVNPGRVDNGDLALFDKTPWQQPGDISSVQRYSTNNSSVNIARLNAIGSDAALVDASYIRLKNIALSYPIPQEFLRFIHVKTARIYTQAQNLVTITKYPGLDPENQSIAVLPPMKTIVLGLQVGF